MKKNIQRGTLSPTRQRHMHQHKSAHRARGSGQVLRRLVRPTCSDDFQGGDHNNDWGWPWWCSKVCLVFSNDIQGEDHENNSDDYDEGDSLVLSKVIEGDDQNDDYDNDSEDDHDDVQRPICLVFSNDIQGDDHSNDEDDHDDVERPVCLVFSKDIQGTTASPRIWQQCGGKETVVHVSLLPECARSSSGGFSYLGQNFAKMVRAQNCWSYIITVVMNHADGWGETSRMIWIEW